ncbi:MAG: S8 family serine peptidase [Candidatus Eremiobacteraeota bacterium]|nr:S8 family serine peptidase [Candidatus Eremiobacteraeota bacterium]
MIGSRLAVGLRVVALASVAAALAGCHHRHLGSALPPTGPTNPNAIPITTLAAASPGGGHGGFACPKGGTPAVCDSAYAITSNPSGLSWSLVDNGNPTQLQPGGGSTGTTPGSATPAVSSHPWQIRFTGGTNGAYGVTIAQVHDGPHSVFYNQQGDSLGRVSTTGLQTVQRLASAAAERSASTASLPVLRRPLARWPVTGVSSTRVFVRYRSAVLAAAGRTPADVERAAGARGHDLPTLQRDPLRVVDVPAGETAPSFASRLQSRADVAGVYPVHLRHPLAKGATAVNDPHMANPIDQWYLNADGFPYAWSYTTGTSATIAVIDTGVDVNNTDLSAKVVFQEKVLGGKVSSTQIDTNGHGTNVASIAAAATNNATGFAGAGYDVKLMAFDIFSDATSSSDQQNGDTGDEAIAIGDAVAHGADVINLSLGAAEDAGGNGYDQGEHDAIEAAIAANVTVVAAAGNDADGSESGTPHTDLDYPAAYDGVIAVGASALDDKNSGTYTNATEVVADYSQYGPGLGVVAPGGRPCIGQGGTGSCNDTDLLHWIWNYSSTTAAYPPDQCTYANGTLPKTPTNCTALFAGTSQATPQVSAAAALLVALAGGHRPLKPAQIAQILESTADNINDPHQGHGRLNAYRALASLVADTAAFSGPVPQAHGTAQLIAFAYANSGSATPTILDYNYPAGVPIASDGTFRIADVRPADAATYKVGVWYDANGDGVIDAGDYVGVSSASCTSSAPCAVGTITLSAVSGKYTLP